jgi:hypothetical protein
MIFWHKIVIFHTIYRKNFSASLRSAQFFLSAPPLTWNPGSAPGIYINTNVYYLFTRWHASINIFIYVCVQRVFYWNQ